MFVCEKLKKIPRAYFMHEYGREERVRENFICVNLPSLDIC